MGKNLVVKTDNFSLIGEYMEKDQLFVKTHNSFIKFSPAVSDSGDNSRKKKKKTALFSSQS